MAQTPRVRKRAELSPDGKRGGLSVPSLVRVGRAALAAPAMIRRLSFLPHPADTSDQLIPDNSGSRSRRGRSTNSVIHVRACGVAH